ncbi:MAG: transcription antitermination factor NusB [Treponema sp.]|nr:MAG: transcription antitermination factor NusB [Treponema sp.]
MNISRRRARILVMQGLYAWEVSGMPVEELLEFSWIKKEKREKLQPADLSFPRLLLAGTIENIEAVDKRICENLHNWKFEDLNITDKSILRFSTYSLLFQKEILPSIVIDEAISIAKDYGTDDSFKFINAILDSVNKQETVNE